MKNDDFNNSFLNKYLLDFITCSVFLLYFLVLLRSNIPPNIYYAKWKNCLHRQNLREAKIFAYKKRLLFKVKIWS